MSERASEESVVERAQYDGEIQNANVTENNSQASRNRRYTQCDRPPNQDFIMKSFYVYIMSSKRNGTLYIGVTNNLEKRVSEHKSGLVPGFSKDYQIKYLVYFEEAASIEDAIEREKQIKRWSRKKKIDLIEKENPEWDDLALCC